MNKRKEKAEARGGCRVEEILKKKKVKEHSITFFETIKE